MSNPMEFNQIITVLTQEIVWTETEGKKLNIVSDDYHNGYVAGLQQASFLLAVQSLDIDAFLRLYGYDPDKVSDAVQKIVNDALRAAFGLKDDSIGAYRAHIAD